MNSFDCAYFDVLTKITLLNNETYILNPKWSVMGQTMPKACIITCNFDLEKVVTVKIQYRFLILSLRICEKKAFRVDFRKA